MDCNYRTVPRSRQDVLAHAGRVIFSAHFVQGLELCDILRRLRGDEEGRTLYRAHGENLDTYPDDIVREIDQFTMH